jgi:hypothetical protein
MPGEKHCHRHESSHTHNDRATQRHSNTAAQLTSRSFPFTAVALSAESPPPSNLDDSALRTRHTAKLDSPPSKASTLHVQRQRQRSNTENLRERSISVRISQARAEDEDQSYGDNPSSPLDMLLGKGYWWSRTKARLPPSRQLLHMIRNPRTLLSLGLFLVFALLWRCMGSAAGEVHRYATSGNGP